MATKTLDLQLTELIPLIAGDVKTIKALLGNTNSIDAGLKGPERASIVAAINALYQKIGSFSGINDGDLSATTTSLSAQKITQLIAALINDDNTTSNSSTLSARKIKELIDQKSASTPVNSSIDDTDTVGADKLWSSQHTKAQIEKAVRDLKTLVLGGEQSAMNSAFDTLKEISDWISADQTGAKAMIERIQHTLPTNEVVQLDDQKKRNVQQSIGLGDLTSLNLVQAYTTARDS